MIEITLKELKQRPIIVELVSAIFFGLLSLPFASLKIEIFGFEGAVANLREIPLLISIFYIRSIWSVLLMCLITTVAPTSFDFLTVFSLHSAALVFAWVMYHKVLSLNTHDWQRPLIWAVICVIYYLVFIIPVLYLVDTWIHPDLSQNFNSYYLQIFGSVKYEMIVTVPVTVMYLVQNDIRNKLGRQEAMLESQVEDRTNKLAKANLQLKEMNENLDGMVIERSNKIKEQLITIDKYANMNSHHLRAPLSNILGLVNLLKRGHMDEQEKVTVIDNIDHSAQNLDTIIKEMNELLENEMNFRPNTDK